MENHIFRSLPKATSALYLSLIVLLVGCSGGGSGGSDEPNEAPSAQAPTTPQTNSPTPSIDTTSGFTELKAFHTNDLSNLLISCAAIDGAGCPLGQLPLLGMEVTAPSVEDVMGRVLVSHDWMGVRFQSILEQMPAEIMHLSRSITAIVISSDIRPSYYDPDTGAIYLDPEGMWLTAAERDDINSESDFRSDFGAELQFVVLWRYVMDGKDLQSMSRSLRTISLNTASLLFHELAHASDFFPQSSLSALDTSLSPSPASSQSVSEGLISQLPLTTQILRDLASVTFMGATATEEQKQIQSTEVSNWFHADVANDFYNYTTRHEDLAMVFEEAMMYYSFGVSRDIAITNLPASNICDDYMVAWGQRNRIAEPAVMARSIYVIESLLPESSPWVTSALLEMPDSTQMTPDVDWCDNLGFLSVGAAAPTTGATSLVASTPTGQAVARLKPYL